SVAFAMFASYFLSRTLSPAFCAYFLKAHHPDEKRFVLFRAADWGFDRLRDRYTGLLRLAIRRRWATVLLSLALLVASLPLFPLIGQELFPATDAGQIVINLRAASGTRIELTEQLTQAVEKEIQSVIPETDRQMIVTDIGVLYDWPAGYTANSGPMDATLLIQLTDAKDRDVSTPHYATELRKRLLARFPEVSFALNTGGMVSAALNFGLPSPINIQVEGRDMKEQYRIAQEIVAQLRDKVPGLVDLRVQRGQEPDEHAQQLHDLRPGLLARSQDRKPLLRRRHVPGAGHRVAGGPEDGHRDWRRYRPSRPTAKRHQRGNR
ncbi:MAG: efflux RND transporter permease subunit, partial [Planctomycetes bacterium]|nr:efflux RND transporter permease subunit [Planctomycetota bacterium]